MFNTKKPIKEFGKIYDYLRDHELRTEERRGGSINVAGADFLDAEFTNVIWKNFIFRRCHFPASHTVRVAETANCMFMNCDFGPGRKDDALSFGKMTNGQFLKCTFTNGNVSFGRGEALFKDCTFENTTPQKTTTWNHFIAGDNLHLVNCKFRHVSLLFGPKLHMQRCDFLTSGSGQMDPYVDYTADVILEDTLLQNAAKLLWNAKINNLTLRRCRVDGLFSAQQSVIRDSIVLEGLKVGEYEFSRTGTEKKIVIRDCHFSEVDKRSNYLFICSADYAAEVLLERVECTNAAPCNLTGASPRTTEKFRTKTTRNQIFTLRDCKIPYLLVNWLQTYHLVIENCEFGTLELKDGRLGNVTIKNTKFETLDLSRTLAGKFEVDAPSAGRIVTAESNYPKGGYKIDKPTK